jgi:ABC-type sugar transport system permease subunit
MGYASALAYLLLLLVGAILIVQRRLLGGDPAEAPAR